MVSLEKEFFSFIYQRQLIWYKRFVLKESPPWTQDYVLRTYKIINVYRELDKCTLYLIDKLRFVNDRKKILINCIFYRFFNQYGLYEMLDIEPFDSVNSVKPKLVEGFERLKLQGKRLFNNAYLISSGQQGKKKHLTILNNLQNLDVETIIAAIDNAKTPRQALIVLENIPMVGPFLACEIWTDLSYFGFFKQNWTDDDFVNIGPGAKWGLEIMFASKLNKNELEEKLRYLHKVQEKYLSNIPELLKWKDIAFNKAFSNYPFLSLTNIEGALCEFRKYWNISHGAGRRKYFTPDSNTPSPFLQ